MFGYLLAQNHTSYTHFFHRIFTMSMYNDNRSPKEVLTKMMMYGIGGAFGWFGMILGIVVHFAFAVMVVLAAVWLYRVLFKKDSAETQDAEMVLKQRYAKGELSLEEFQTMKRHLAE